MNSRFVCMEVLVWLAANSDALLALAVCQTLKSMCLEREYQNFLAMRQMVTYGL